MTTVLVLGGARSGKSAYAERLVAQRSDVTYIAAGPAPAESDPEWSARVAAHRDRRPASWRTLEAGANDGSSDRVAFDLARVLHELPPESAALVDCLGTWVTRLVDDAGAWTDRAAAERLVAEHTARLVAALDTCAADVVLVSNETGLGVVPATASGRLFRDLLGRVNTAVSAACRHTVLVVAGRVLDLSATPTMDEAPTFGLSGAPDSRDDIGDGIDLWADAGLTWDDEDDEPTAPGTGEREP